MTIRDGILIGAVGGACAGITVWLVQSVCMWINESWHKRLVYRWMLNNTANEDGNRSVRLSEKSKLVKTRLSHRLSILKPLLISSLRSWSNGKKLPSPST